MDLLIFWLRTDNADSTILVLISEGNVLDHHHGAVLVHLTKTKPRECNLTSFVLCLQTNLYGAMEENFVAMSITALGDSGKLRSLRQNVLTV